MLVKSVILPQLKLLAQENWSELSLFTCTGRFPHFHRAHGGVRLKIKLLFARNVFFTVLLCVVFSLTWILKIPIFLAAYCGGLVGF